MINLTDKEFNTIAAYMKENYGVNLFEKKLLIEGRLQRVLLSRNLSSFSEYFDLVKSDKTVKEAEELINKLTTNYTFFMREKEHFQLFKDEILPYLSNNSESKYDFRIWSAGCSSGEEAYTLAMITDDYFMGNKGGRDTKILATDISSKVLNMAVKGIYPKDELKYLPEKFIHKYFNEQKDNIYEIKSEIKKEVIFRKFNLMEDKFPFKRKFHVIFCRNVMIYFDMETKKKLIKTFYNVLESGGYLFIGHSESINHRDYNFKYVMPSVYRKI